MEEFEEKYQIIFLDISEAIYKMQKVVRNMILRRKRRPDERA